jgi:hypothetical protein
MNTRVIPAKLDVVFWSNSEFSSERDINGALNGENCMGQLEIMIGERVNRAALRIDQQYVRTRYDGTFRSAAALAVRERARRGGV